MQKKITYILIFLISSVSFGQKIKTITEYKKESDSLIKTRKTEFDKSGNLTKEVRFGGYDGISKTFRNKNRIIKYNNGKRFSEYNCEDFVAKDTCVIRSFSTYEFDPKTKIEKQTKYETDSLIRFIREVKRQKRIRVSKTNSWEFIPVKEPDFEKALILTDTSYFDKKNRLIKRVNYNSRAKEPYIEKYVYSKDKYTYQTIGTARDTILSFEYTKLQQKIDKKSIDYKLNSTDIYEYEIEYH
ncbi:hypothetical protein [Lutibacter citreus]|uniref:hypothetical protein n=1 Tax=Lutibacter citreus TaxID=2138210 RepID=UPI000DBE8610|nr:hypothetical protein [Lutibacter citreus]